MTEKEIRENYPPRKCESQIEFDRLMSDMNTAQTHLNHPHLDRLRELAKQKANIQTQIQALKVQLNSIRIERLEIEERQKVINRTFHDLKHELIMLNPREEYAKQE